MGSNADDHFLVLLLELAIIIIKLFYMFSLSTIQNILNHVEGSFDCQFATLGCWIVKNYPLYLP